MHAQQQSRSRRECPLEVFNVNAVGRSNLDQLSAAAFEHFGQTKSAADLHELIASHDNLAALRKRIEHEEHGGGAVVDDERVFCPGNCTQRLPDGRVARAALAGFQIVLEI